MKVTKITIELESGHRLEVLPDNASLGGLTPADADLLGKIATPESMAGHFKAIGDAAINFLKGYRWR